MRGVLVSCHQPDLVPTIPSPRADTRFLILTDLRSPGAYTSTQIITARSYQNGATCTRDASVGVYNTSPRNGCFTNIIEQRQGRMRSAGYPDAETCSILKFSRSLLPNPKVSPATTYRRSTGRKSNNVAAKLSAATRSALAIKVSSR